MKDKEHVRFKDSLKNLKSAYLQLAHFIADPVVTRRDRAGVIQAFEFTYELFWKTLQKLAQYEQIEAATPRASIQAGFQMGIIEDPEESIWLSLMKDRNLTCHTYHEDLSIEIYERIKNQYSPVFKKTLLRLEAIQF